MEVTWTWDQLGPTERQIAEFLLEGKSNKEICGEMFLSRARVQEYVRRIVTKTGARSTRRAITLLAEERESLSLVRVLDQVRDGVGILQDGVCRHANRALAELSGYSVEELTGMPFADLMAPEYRQMQQERYEQRMAGARFPVSYRTNILRKGGEVKEVSVSSAGIIRWRGRPAIVGVLHVEE